MKIWIVNQNAYTPAQSAGTRHFEMSLALQQRGHEVLVIASSFYHKSRQETREYGRSNFLLDNVDGVDFCWVRTPGYRNNPLKRLTNMLVFMWRVWRGRMLRELPSPDIIIGSSPPLFGAYAAMRLARRLSTPFVLEVRDLWPDSLVDLGVAGKKNPLVLLMRFVERQLYRGAQLVVTLLPASTPFFVGHGVPEEDIVWIPNAYSGITAQDDSTHSTESKADGITLMYTGVHGHYSHLDLLLDAMAILRDLPEARGVRLRMIGDGPLKPALKEYALRKGLRNVSFEEARPKNELAAVTKAADAFVLVKKQASIYRWGFSPNKLFDYMAQAKPVIFAGEIAHDYVKLAVAGVSTAPNPESLAEGIMKIANLSVEHRLRLGQNAREYVKTHHDMGVLADRLMERLAAMRKV